MFQPQSLLTAKLGWTAQSKRPQVTSDQRRNVMACRKLAQQRVLRIMQQQSAEQAARMATECADGGEQKMRESKLRRPNTERRKA